MSAPNTPILIALCPLHLCVIPNGSVCPQCLAAAAGTPSQEATNTKAAAPDGAAARESELASCAERVRAAWTAVEVAEAQHKRLEEAERVAFRAASDARAMLRHTGDVLLRAATQGSA